MIAGMRAFAIDLGGGHATVALLADGMIVGRESLEITGHEPIGPALPRFATTIRGLAARAGVRVEDAAGLAWGFPALVDGRVDRVVSTNQKYEDAPSIDFVAWAKRELGLRLRLENDARLALLGEREAGAAKGYDDVFLFTLGTGIGGVAMMEGKLVRGKHGQAGCLGGHVPVVVGGRPCTCGSVGCAESEAAGWSLPLVARERAGFDVSALAREPRITFEALFRCARAGDALAIALRQHCLGVWCAAAVTAVHAFDPELVVYGGGVMAAADEILPTIRAHVERHTWTGWGKVAVRAAALGNDAALYGALPLLHDAAVAKP